MLYLFMTLFHSIKFSNYEHTILWIKILSAFDTFFVILFLLDLKTNCFRYIDNASMLFSMLCDTFECWFNLSISWTRWRSCKVRQFIQKNYLSMSFFLIFYINVLYEFNFSSRVAGEYVTILMAGLPVRHSFIPIINIFSYM